MGIFTTRSFELTLPNDTYFEYEAELNFTPGTPGKFSGPPENCYEAEPDECELYDVLFFTDLAQVIEVACWINNCVMSYTEIQDLASEEEKRVIDSVFNNPPDSEPECEPEYEPDYD